MDDRSRTLRRRVPLALALVFVGTGLARLLDARDHRMPALLVLVALTALAVVFVAQGVRHAGRAEDRSRSR